MAEVAADINKIFKKLLFLKLVFYFVEHRSCRGVPGSINKTEKARRWGMVGESQMGGATVVLPYAGH